MLLTDEGSKQEKAMRLIHDMLHIVLGHRICLLHALNNLLPRERKGSKLELKLLLRFEALHQVDFDLPCNGWFASKPWKWGLRSCGTFSLLLPSH